MISIEVYFCSYYLNCLAKTIVVGTENNSLFEYVTLNSHGPVLLVGIENEKKSV